MERGEARTGPAGELQLMLKGLVVTPFFCSALQDRRLFWGGKGRKNEVGKVKNLLPPG